MNFDEWYDGKGLPRNIGKFDLLRHAWGEATRIERDACAKACEAQHVGEDVHDDCDNYGDMAYNQALRDAADAIRARGDK